MNFSDFMKGLRLNKVRNIIIYASFIFLLVSLVVNLQGIDNNLVQRASFAFLVFGCYWWFLEDLIYAFGEKFRMESEQFLLFVIWIFLIIFGFFVAYKFSFGQSLLDTLNNNPTIITNSSG